jgi:hypothetical protein
MSDAGDPSSIPWGEVIYFSAMALLGAQVRIGIS